MKHNFLLDYFETDNEDVGVTEKPQEEWLVNVINITATQQSFAFR